MVHPRMRTNNLRLSRLVSRCPLLPSIWCILERRLKSNTLGLRVAPARDGLHHRPQPRAERHEIEGLRPRKASQMARK